MNFCLEWGGRFFTTVKWWIYSSTAKSSCRTGSLSAASPYNHGMCTAPTVSWVSEGVWLHQKHPECSMCSTQDLHKAFSLQCFFIYATEMQTTALHHSSYLKLHISEPHPSDTESMTEIIIPNKKWSLSALPHYHYLKTSRVSKVFVRQQMASLWCV